LGKETGISPSNGVYYLPHHFSDIGGGQMGRLSELNKLVKLWHDAKLFELGHTLR
jgi:hypothetical protein